MRPRIQVKLVKEHVKYLEEQVRVMEPAFEIMKKAVEKSKAWIEDKNENSSVSYSVLCQELESATTAMLDACSKIMNDNKEPVDVEEEAPSLFQPIPHTTATEKLDCCESTPQVFNLTKSTMEIISRLKLIETNVSSLQDTAHKAKIDISELKLWKDNFVTETCNMNSKIEQLSRKQKLKFRNIRKQISEQENKANELNKEIESLEKTETKSNKSLETLSLDLKEYENNLQKINTEMQVYRDEIKRLSDLISDLQDVGEQNAVERATQFEDLYAKHSVINKVLQQRLMPIDKLIQIFNQNLETRETNIRKLGPVEVHVKKLLKCVHALQQEVKSHFDCIITLQEDRNKNEANISNTIETLNLKIETSAKEVLRLSTDLKTLEPRVCSPYFFQIYLKTDKVFAAGSIISTFQSVMERNGSHFNQTTGKLVAPDDRCYLVIVTLQESDGRLISVRVCVEGNSKKNVFVTSAVCVSTIVDMKKGEKLYFELILADVRAKLQTSSGFTIVSL